MIALFATIRNMKIITLSGVDGSGKSTQLGLLQKKLESQGKKVAYFHAVEFSLANKLFSKNSTESGTAKKAITEASFFSLLLRKAILPVDLLRFHLHFQALYKQGFDYILSDRYFYDTFINIEYLAKKRIAVPAVVFCLLIKPDTAFYIDLPPEVIMTRERAPEQGLEYLQDKAKLFKNKVSPWDLTVIDGNRDQASAFQDIVNQIEGDSVKE